MKMNLAYITVLMATVCLFSCRSRQAAISPVILNHIDSIRTEYIERTVIDTMVVEVAIPYEVVSQTVRDSMSYLETHYAESWAWIDKDGMLGHKLSNKEASIPAEVLVPTTTKESTTTATSIEELPVPYAEPVYVERDFTRWESFRLGAFWWLLGISFALVVWVLRTPLFTLIKKFVR